MGAQRTARCVKMMGKGVVKVVHRCDDAKENNNLDLSDCQLQQVPDAIFMLMQHTSLVSCNLSHNVINKIPAKLAIKWTLLTELNVSHNRISSLPDELSHCTALEPVEEGGARPAVQGHLHQGGPQSQGAGGVGGPLLLIIKTEQPENNV